MISAKIICDSKNEFGNRITTFVLTFPRIILAEFNTHRMISKNSASSRAIPFNKMMDMVLQDPFIPIKWMKEHKGMQGYEYFDDTVSEKFKRIWLQLRSESVERAQQLSMSGVSKQMCNRLLEPFLYHTVICTGTEWENFFALRAHDAAEIHMQDLAFKMLKAYNESTPKELKAGEWHIPFGDTFDDHRLLEILSNEYGQDAAYYGKEVESDIERMKIKIATGRCARISYNNFEGKDDYEADIKLHDSLLSSGHMSPFEHVAQSMSESDIDNHVHISKYSTELGWSGNFMGFVQYRKTLPGENKKDGRVK